MDEILKDWVYLIARAKAQMGPESYSHQAINTKLLSLEIAIDGIKDLKSCIAEQNALLVELSVVIERLIRCRVALGETNENAEKFRDALDTFPPLLDRLAELIEASKALSKRRVDDDEGSKGEPTWIVNNLGELGVKVGNRFFFLYKGDNIEYHDGDNDDPDDIDLKYRPVGKREFGEVCNPIHYFDKGYNMKDEYDEPLIVNGELSESEKDYHRWKPLPLSKRLAEKEEE